MTEKTPEKKNRLADDIGRRAERMKSVRDNPEPSPLRGLGTFGMIGWSVAVPAVGGAFLGLWLDRIAPQGFSWTHGADHRRSSARQSDRLGLGGQGRERRMTEIDIGALLLGLAVGVGMSALFFAGLNLGMRLALRATRPTPILLLSAGVRIGVFLAAGWLVAQADIWAFCGYAAAFLLVRYLAISYTRHQIARGDA